MSVPDALAVRANALGARASVEGRRKPYRPMPSSSSCTTRRSRRCAQSCPDCRGGDRGDRGPHRDRNSHGRRGGAEGGGGAVGGGRQDRPVHCPARPGVAGPERGSGAHVAGFLRSLSQYRNMVTSVASAPAVAGFASRAGVALREAGSVAVKVVDSLAENGAKLVGCERDVATLRRLQPGIRIVPVRTYRTARFERRTERQPGPPAGPRAAAAGPSSGTRVRVVVSRAGPPSPAPGDRVYQLQRPRRRGGDHRCRRLGEPDAERPHEDLAALRLSGVRVLEPPSPGCRARTGDVLPLKAIGLDVPDVLRHFYARGDDRRGRRPRRRGRHRDCRHPDLTVEGGRNTTGEGVNDFGDNGQGHGTHVAGIIAGRGTAPAGVRGLAPGRVSGAIASSRPTASTATVSRFPRRSTSR